MVKIGVIGGHGNLGNLIVKTLEQDGFDVIVSDFETEITNIVLAKTADVIIVSVPINKTSDIIEEIKPYLSQKQLIMDVTSVKSEPVNQMLKTSADVIGLHPMFGSHISSLKGQTIVMVKGRDNNNWFDKVQNYFKDKELKVKETTAKHHDKMMALIQVLVHFNTISLGHTMASLGYDVKETLEFTSPIYKMELSMVGRIFAQDPDLYGSIPLNNPHTKDVLKKHKENSEKLMQIINGKNLDEFVDWFNDTAEYFDNFKIEALQESKKVIEELVNLYEKA